MISLRLRETQTYKRTRAFLHRYERFLMPTMLIGGTTLDAIQFRLLNIQTTFLISAIYALICAGSMIIMASNVQTERRFLRYVQLAAPYLQQFTIGALLSTSLLFYWFSGALSASWPIIGLVAVLMVSNEVLRKYFTRASVQIGIFAFILFSLCATAAAYIFNSLSPLVFLAGGTASLLLSFGFLTIYQRRAKIGKRTAWLTISAIFVFMNAFYFLNVLPPIPLALREAGMYEKVTSSRGDYILEGPEENWIERILPGQTMTIVPGQALYAYTSIFAPADLTTKIVHRWQKYDPESRRWETADELSFAVSGGRSEGFRGYTVKTALSPGKWRVSVETPRGQVLGRIGFTIEYATP